MALLLLASQYPPTFRLEGLFHLLLTCYHSPPSLAFLTSLLACIWSYGSLTFSRKASTCLSSEFVPNWRKPGRLQSMRSRKSDTTERLSMRATEENLGKSLHSWRPQCSYHLGEIFSILLAPSLERVSKDPEAGLHRCPFPPPNTPGSVLDAHLLTLVSPDQAASISHLAPCCQPGPPPVYSGAEGSCMAYVTWCLSSALAPPTAAPLFLAQG